MSIQKPDSDLTVIVRSVGERTETLCKQLLTDQVQESNIFIINERPFTKAIAKTYEIGIENQRKWTLCIDADVLIKEGAVNELLQKASEADENVFEIQGNVLDKFFGGPRAAGNHLYRTSLLKKAIGAIPSPNVSLRPESFTIKQMAAKGYPWIEIDLIVGIHDYEQYYKDIIRKTFIQAKKHGRFMPVLTAYWERMKNEDTDYQVALWGAKELSTYTKPLTIDVKNMPDGLNKLLKYSNIKEKEDIITSTERFTGNNIKVFIDSYVPPVEFNNFIELTLHSPTQQKDSGLVKSRNKGYTKQIIDNIFNKIKKISQF
jgi:hypothetical protein